MLRVEVVCGGQNAELRHLTSDINITREDNPHFYKIKLTKKPNLIKTQQDIDKCYSSSDIGALACKIAKIHGLEKDFKKLIEFSMCWNIFD